MGDSELVHRMQTLPSLAVHIEQVDLTVSVGVLASYQDDFRRAHGQGAACPKWILKQRKISQTS